MARGAPFSTTIPPPQPGGRPPSRAPRHSFRIAVLEVHVPDAVPKASQTIERVSAAVAVVPRVQTEADEVGRRQVKEGCRLLRRLYERARVVVEHSAQARLFAHRVGDPLHAIREVPPPGLAQPVLRTDPSR